MEQTKVSDQKPLTKHIYDLVNRHEYDQAIQVL